MKSAIVCSILLVIATIDLIVAEDGSVPDGTIYGHVFDAITKQPLSQAFVYCQDVKCSKPVTTNAAGYFVTDPCFTPSKTYTFQCTKHGYKTSTKSVTTDQNGKAEADFNLEAEGSKSSGNQPPILVSLTPDKSSPQNEGTIITWTAKATDPENDPILYEFFQNGKAVTGWRSDNIWTNCWANELPSGYACGNGTVPKVGDNQIEVWVRDGKHAGPEGFDDNKFVSFAVYSGKENQSIKAVIKGIISGKIINAASLKPVPRADVGIKDSTDYIYSGVADENGYFRSPSIFHPQQGYEVISDTFGYTPVAQNVVTDENGNATVSMSLPQEFEVNPETCAKYGGNWQDGGCDFVH